jgi:nicotinamidase-related amidase
MSVKSKIVLRKVYNMRSDSNSTGIDNLDVATQTTDNCTQSAINRVICSSTQLILKAESGEASVPKVDGLVHLFIFNRIPSLFEQEIFLKRRKIAWEQRRGDWYREDNGRQIVVMSIETEVGSHLAEKYSPAQV